MNQDHRKMKSFPKALDMRNRKRVTSQIPNKLERDTAEYFAALSPEAVAEERSLEASFDQESAVMDGALDPDTPLEADSE